MTGSCRALPLLRRSCEASLARGGGAGTKSWGRRGGEEEKPGGEEGQMAELAREPRLAARPGEPAVQWEERQDRPLGSACSLGA